MSNSLTSLFGLNHKFVKRKIRAIRKPKILAIDFDGCLTDDHVLVDASGNELVRASRKDGLGASRLQRLGITVVIISTEKNQVVSQRARKMNVDVMQGVENKQRALTEFAQNKSIEREDIWAVGNDINDLSLFDCAIFTMCPEDAASEVKSKVNLTLPINGGEGILNYLARILEDEKSRSSY